MRLYSSTHSVLLLSACKLLYGLVFQMYAILIHLAAGHLFYLQTGVDKAGGESLYYNYTGKQEKVLYAEPRRTKGLGELVAFSYNQDQKVI